MVHTFHLLPQLINKLRQPNILAVVIRGAGAAFGVRVLGFALSYLLNILLARWLGATEYGIYAYVMAWGHTLAILAGLGLPTMALRFIPEYREHQAWGELSGLVRRSWQIAFYTAVGFASLGAALAIWLQRSQQSPYAVPLLLGVWVIPLIALMTIQQDMVRALRKMILAYAPFMVFRPLLIIGGVYLLLQLGYKLNSLFVISLTLVSLLVLMVTQLRLLWRSLPADVLRASPVYNTRNWLRVSIPLWLVAGSTLLMNQTDILMIGAIVGPAEAGMYNVATKTTNVVSFILVSANAIAAPMIASFFASNDRASLQRLVSTVAHGSFWPSLILAVGMVLFSKPLLAIFGPEFIAAQGAFIILIVGKLFEAGAGIAGYLMSMTGHQNLSARVFIWTVIINIVLNAVLIPVFGIWGAALATTTSTIMWNVWLTILAVKNLHIYPAVFSSYIFRRSQPQQDK